VWSVPLSGPALAAMRSELADVCRCCCYIQGICARGDLMVKHSWLVEPLSISCRRCVHILVKSGQCVTSYPVLLITL